MYNKCITFDKTHINSSKIIVTVTPSTRVVKANAAAAAVDGNALMSDGRVGLLASPRPADVVAATDTTYCCIGIRFAIST